ncbi:MAG: anthranilate synthase component I [Verrucomicrobiales bacterium]|nr:anthranilate synthase component I [Verrucomicrobiales bacterium]
MHSSANSPVIPHSLDLSLSPVEVAKSLRHLPGFLFYDTATTSSEMSAPGMISIIGAMPDMIVSGILNEDQEKLRKILKEDEEACAQADCGVPLGGLFGHVEFDGSYHFGRYRKLLIFRHDRKEWLDVGGLSTWIDHNHSREEKTSNLHFSGGLGPDLFCSMVERAKEYIAAGDIYQVNLSHCFEADWPENRDPFDLYLRLRDCSPSPYASFYEISGKVIISSSPECFLNMSGLGIATKPIKGTRPRFNDPGEDERSAYELMTSPKEIAELVMITDLERNDLGQVCEYGSVRVSELLKLERFPQVFHLVSSIEGQLKLGKDHLGALSACFPGGSISGAPKLRALEIITELEHLPRGLYTGAIGYLGANWESQFSIAIRTGIIESGKLSFHVGAGIVADSDPLAEYEETLHKAAGFFAAAEEF